MRAIERNREFTGRHMLAIMLVFFGVIISVNVTMAVFARTSWTGFVVKNSYVASQEFNGRLAEARAQAALGWTETLTIADGRVGFTLIDREGRPVPILASTLTLKRPAYEGEDEVVQLAVEADGASANHAVRDGIWIATVEADVGLEHPFVDARRIVVSGGRMR